MFRRLCIVFFFFNDTATTEIYTLSLHDALPICGAAAPRPVSSRSATRRCCAWTAWVVRRRGTTRSRRARSEEHTSELQSRQYLVCRLLLEKKKKPNSLSATHPSSSPETKSSLCT